MAWKDVFAIWYIGCFLIVFGGVMVWKGQALCACRRFFYRELRDPQLGSRFASVVDRRDELEGDATTAWRITGLSSALIGVLVLLRVLSPVVGYALLCADFAIMMSQIYLSMHNRSERRAASLQRRTPTTSVPALWYGGALVGACLPLAMAVYPSARISAVIVAIATAAIAVIAMRTANMAALLAGDDPDVEIYVDNRLRWSRVAGMLALAYASSFFFVQLTGPPLRQSPPLVAVADVVSTILCIAFGAWAATVFFNGRMRSPTSRAGA